MWVLSLSRREMVDLLAPGPPPLAIESDARAFRPQRSDQMVAVWPARPDQFGRMPTVIVVPDAALRDVMAWLVTYIRDYRPFTAFCRIVEWTIANQFLSGPSAPTLSGMEGICAGLVLGEALAQARGASAALDLPSTVYSATLAYAISRMFALTSGVMSLKAVTQSWMQTRMLTGQHDLSVDPDVIHRVCGVAMGFAGSAAQERPSLDACAAAWSDIMRTGEISEPSWQGLVDGLPEIEPLRMLVKLPREQRLQGVELAINSLIRVRREAADRRSFLAGYFASLLAPGTLDHADFLLPVAPILPASLMWYCLFAAASHRGEPIPSSNAVASRIVRDLTLPDRLIDRPRCDIALDEFALASPAALPGVTGRGGRLDVDLLPGVTTSVRWPPRQGVDEDAARRARDAQLNQIVSEMQMLTAHQRALAERLREILGIDAASKPSTSQPPPRKRKGGGS